MHRFPRGIRATTNEAQVFVRVAQGTIEGSGGAGGGKEGDVGCWCDSVNEEPVFGDGGWLPADLSGRPPTRRMRSALFCSVIHLQRAAGSGIGMSRQPI